MAGSGRFGLSPLSSAVPPPRALSPINSAVPLPTSELEEGGRGRAWAFRSDAYANSGGRDALSPGPAAPDGWGASQMPEYSRARSPQVIRAVPSGTYSPNAPSRHSPSRGAQSPTRLSGGGISFPRSLSPGLLENSSATQIGSAAVRARSPSGGLPTVQLSEGGGGFNWSAAPPLSPRTGLSSGVSRIASPNGSQSGPQRVASPSPVLKAQAVQQQTQGFKQGFTWSPDPVSPRAYSPRSYSPSGGVARAPGARPVSAGGSSSNNVPRWSPP